MTAQPPSGPPLAAPGPDTMRAALEASTARLVPWCREVAEGSDWARSPSRLPGWTRAHLLAHVAANAAAISRAVTTALDGSPQPSYDGPNGRERGIEAGARRPIGALLDAVDATAADLGAAFLRAARTPGGWQTVTVDRGPVSDSLGFRWREVEIHAVDLDAGYGPDDWPDEFADWLFPIVRAEWQDRLGRDVIADVDGNDRAVLAWAIGRPIGVQSNGRPWPELPAWD